MSGSKVTHFSLPRHLLWEYELDGFDYERNAELVIERVLQRGNIREWRATQQYYGKARMLAVARASRQLTEREQAFTELYVESSLNDPHRGGRYQAGDLRSTTASATGRATEGKV